MSKVQIKRVITDKEDRQKFIEDYGKSLSVISHDLEGDTLIDSNHNRGTDGIMYANRIPQPDYFEVKSVYTPVKVFADTLNISVLYDWSW